MAMDTDALARLDEHPEARRIRSRRLNDGIATLIVDATGLRNAERSNLEHELHDAALAVEGVTEVRIAMTASQPRRTLIAVGSGKGGVGKSTVAANLAIALHPFIIGRAFRAKPLERALAHIREREAVWITTGSAIADWYNATARQ